ncbi:hypothetical protein CVT26_002396 [Gymnopilus dilepis]|uniref:F-box domain-containing protein n=1 Tax=Gymnopilus dilepis TaxID=231916 RepID=A0A409Y3K4_9AGAR|nr:hypothetical protein CVT26_002396 [Gymnopilus dilepis]
MPSRTAGLSLTGFGERCQYFPKVDGILAIDTQAGVAVRTIAKEHQCLRIRQMQLSIGASPISVFLAPTLIIIHIRIGSISHLENMLLQRDSVFLRQFFSTWDIQTIVMLSQTNKRLHLIVKLYSTKTWNVKAFIGHYFRNQDDLINLLVVERLVIFGPAVFSFFDRLPFQIWPLDICISVTSMDNFLRLLQNEGYNYVDGPPGVPSFETAVIGELIRTPLIKLKSNGERNSSEADRSAWGPYVFSKDKSHGLRIKVYVVRCEPYQHVLSLRATGMMNIIMCDYAVSLFPRSTFLHRYSFISRQEDAPSYFPLRNEHYWLEQHRKIFNVSTIGLTHKPFEDVEIGRRAFGDKLSWTIPMLQPGPNEFTAQHGGPCFEVLDWTSDTTRVDSFLRIGEPEVWRSVNVIFTPISAKHIQQSHSARMQTTLSVIEHALLEGDVHFILYFFDQWEPQEIFIMASTNKRLANIVQYYVHKRWNVEDFIGKVFSRPGALLELLDCENGVVFGPAVFKFFDRTLNRPSIVDVCIHGRTLEKFLRLLCEEGFELASYNKKTEDVAYEISESLSRMHSYKLKSSGERNQSEADRAAWGPYEFSKHINDKSRGIRLHIVRCEPYRHILSLYSTGLMNMIAWKQAISLFPKSTFSYRRSFVSAQDATLAKQSYSRYKTWFDEYAAFAGIEIIGLTHRRYGHVEIGTRFVSDDSCWIIPMHPDSGNLCRIVFTYAATDNIVTGSDLGERQPPRKLNGLSFEALDWSSGTTRAESYLRIGEPKVWRYAPSFAYQKRQTSD